MKKFLVWICLALLAAGIFTGCTSMNNLTSGIAQKSVSGSGLFTVQRVGLDKTTQTPELFNIMVWGDYSSFAAGDELLRFEFSDDASIFNSNAKSKKIKLIFGSGDKKRMDKVIENITQNIKSELGKK